MMTIGSLFSGIGGLELGLEWAGLGPVLWQAEADAFKRKILAKHWPEVKRYDDVRDIDERAGRVDVLCGGFPCQDLSSAGALAGIDGPRSGLWKEFRRAIGALRPRWVVVENVTSGAAGWVDVVREDLEGLGYQSLPFPLEATWLGAPQGRARTFIVAHPYAQRESPQPKHAEMAQPSPLGREPSWGTGAWPEPSMVRVVHGLPRGVDGRRCQALGDAVMPQMAETIGYIIRELEGI